MDNDRRTRKLTAIFSADVVGYSRLMRDDELATIDLLSSYRELMTDLVDQHKGRVIDTPGDNMLAEFSSVVDAVQSAVAMQRELRARNGRFPEDRRMLFRIGINIGDVVQDEDRIYGDGVNIAARLEKIADPGGICISRSAYDQIESKLPFGYEYLGEKTAKNIDKPLYAYRVQIDPEQGRSHPPPISGTRRGSGVEGQRESSSVSGMHVSVEGAPVHGAEDAIGSAGPDAQGDPQLAKAIREIKGRIRAFAEEMSRSPLERDEAIRGLMQNRQVRFILGFGLFLFVINALTSFGAWWFQYPLLVAGLISYLSWTKSGLKSTKRISALRDRIFTEELALLSDRTKPTSKEITRINRRINRCVGFYRSVYIYIGVSGFLLLLNLATSPFSWWFQYPLVGLGFLLFLRWQTVRKHLPQEPGSAQDT